MNKNQVLGTDQQDALCEISNICSGHAAGALSQMLQKEVRISIPVMKSVPYEKALEEIGDEEKIVGAVLLQMTDELNGMFLLLYDLGFANSVLEPLLGETITDLTGMNEDHVSVMSEIGNIVIGNYVTVLSELTKSRIDISVPQTTVNMLGGILSVPMAAYGYETNELMYTETEFLIDDQRFTNWLMMIPDQESLMRILERTGA